MLCKTFGGDNFQKEFHVYLNYTEIACKILNLETNWMQQLSQKGTWQKVKLNISLKFQKSKCSMTVQKSKWSSHRKKRCKKNMPQEDSDTDRKSCRIRYLSDTEAEFEEMLQQLNLVNFTECKTHALKCNLKILLKKHCYQCQEINIALLN